MEEGEQARRGGGDGEPPRGGAIEESEHGGDSQERERGDRGDGGDQRDHGHVASGDDAPTADRVGQEELQRPVLLAAGDGGDTDTDAEDQEEDGKKRGEEPGMEVSGRRGDRQRAFRAEERADALREVVEGLLEAALALDARIESCRRKHEGEHADGPSGRAANAIVKVASGDGSHCRGR